ncbi:MAG: hypothetical protein AAF830_02085 [Pseudomonadota bacterium]
MRDHVIAALRTVPLLALAFQGPAWAMATEDGPMMTICRGDGTRVSVPFPLDDGDVPAPHAEYHACHAMMRPDRDDRSGPKAPA